MAEVTTSGALEERLAGAGAVFGEVAGRRVARHYGDQAAEYGAVREAAGLVSRADLAHVRMWGKDPVRMLQGLITNDLAGAGEGRGVYAAMLTPKGRVITELRAFRRTTPAGTEVLLELPREALAATAEQLKKFVPPLFARWADASKEWGTLGVYGPRARALASQVLGTELPELAEDAFIEVAFADLPVLVIGTHYAGGEDGYDLTAPADALPALWETLREATARPVGFGALETLRIEAGRPRSGAELTEEVIATEAYEGAGLLERAVSFHKGCYTGQEVIVRIAHRGRVNRLLRGLLLGDEPTPAPGTPLFHPESGKEVGRTTSAALSPRFGQAIALAYVRREVEPAGRVRVGSADGVEAEVSALPFPAPA
jgi:folate-binding protein YgfZ